MTRRRLLRGGAALLGLLALAATVLWAMNRGAEARYREAFQRMRGAGVPVDPLEFAPPPLPPGPNAADLYLEAFHLSAADFHDFPDDRIRKTLLADAGLLDRPPESLSAEEWREIEERVRGHPESLEALLRARSVLACRFPLEYDKGWNTLMPHVRCSIAAARLLGWDVRGRLRAGKPEGVWERIDAVLALDHAIATEPMLVSQLTRCLIRELGLDLIREALPAAPPSPEGAEAFSRRLDPEPFLRSMRRSCLFEIAMTVDTMDGFLRGRTTIRELDREVSGLKRWLALPRMKDAAARGFDRLARLRPALDGPRDTLISQAEGILGEFQADPLSFSFLVANYPKAWRRQVVLETRSLLAAEAMRIKARFPDCTLLPEAIPALPADPLSGKPIRYRRVECGFLLELDADPAELRAQWGIEDIPAWECAR